MRIFAPKIDCGRIRYEFVCETICKNKNYNSLIEKYQRNNNKLLKKVTQLNIFL